MYIPERLDLTGQRFGSLTVLEFDEEETKERHYTMWKVRCDYGIIYSVPTSGLTTGHTTKCKYCRNSKNLVGQKFGRLTVIERCMDEETNKTKWRCKCNCGNETLVTGSNLTRGKTKSCGCIRDELRRNAPFQNLLEKTFGLLTVTKLSENRTPTGGRIWVCNCACGTKNHEVTANNLLNGHTRSCGCGRSKSYGEEKITVLLRENNINFKREYMPLDCFLSSGHHPRFDFAILNKDNTIAYFIEYQGKQHYEPTGTWFEEKVVAEIQKRDREKKQYCDNKGIPLIYIKYTQYDNLDIKDLYFPELIH